MMRATAADERKPFFMEQVWNTLTLNKMNPKEKVKLVQLAAAVSTVAISIMALKALVTFSLLKGLFYAGLAALSYETHNCFDPDTRLGSTILFNRSELHLSQFQRPAPIFHKIGSFVQNLIQDQDQD